MAANFKRHWFGLGLAIGTCVALVAIPASARAQFLERKNPAQTVPLRTTPVLPNTDSAATALQPAILNSVSADPDEPPVRLPAGIRRVPKDGDLPGPEQNALASDGIVTVGEPPAIADGLDSTEYDTRPIAEAAAFADPAGGIDSLLFQIDDLDPLSDRRVERLARLDPYDPIGIAVGSFVFFPEIVIAAHANNNVFDSPRARSDQALGVIAAGRLASNWSNHALELSATGNSKSYSEFDSEDELGYAAEARGRLDIRRNTNIQARIAADLTQESRSAIDASRAGDRADINSREAGLSFNHRFNRLAIQLRGSLADTNYSDVRTPAGIISNDDRDFVESSEAIRASWNFNPRMATFAEIGLNQREFDTPVRSDGIKRDSDGERYRLGAAFGSNSTKLRGELSLGYARQKPDDNRLEEVDGLLVDANLAWRLSALTSVRFSARTDIFDTTEAGSGGVLERQAGVELRHAFRRYLIANAGVSFFDRDYAGIALAEDELRFNAGLEYFLRREAVLFGSYEFTRFDSNQPAEDYDGSEFQVGLRLRR